MTGVDISDLLILAGAGILLAAAWLVGLIAFLAALGTLLLAAGLARANMRRRV